VGDERMMKRISPGVWMMAMLLGACAKSLDPFDEQQVIEVSVELDAAEWETLRH